MCSCGLVALRRFIHCVYGYVFVLFPFRAFYISLLLALFLLYSFRLQSIQFKCFHCLIISCVSVRACVCVLSFDLDFPHFEGE